MSEGYTLSYFLYAWEIFDHYIILSITLSRLNDSTYVSDASEVSSVMNSGRSWVHLLWKVSIQEINLMMVMTIYSTKQ